MDAKAYEVDPTLWLRPTSLDRCFLCHKKQRKSIKNRSLRIFMLVGTRTICRKHSINIPRAEEIKWRGWCRRSCRQIRVAINARRTYTHSSVVCNLNRVLVEWAPHRFDAKNILLFIFVAQRKCMNRTNLLRRLCVCVSVASSFAGLDFWPEHLCTYLLPLVKSVNVHATKWIGLL